MRRFVPAMGLIFLAVPFYCVAGGPVLTHRQDVASQPVTDSGNTLALTVPAETLIKARLLSGMHTLVSHANDPILAEMTEPIYIDGRLALPRGTLFDGHITAVRTPRRMRRSGEIAFRFDHVTLPTGEQVPVSAVIASLEKAKGLQGELDAEGHLVGHRRHSWKGLLTGFLTVGGLAAGRAVVVSSAALTVAAPASAAAFAGYEIFFRHGGNVNVPPLTRCRIRLNSSLTI